MSFLLSMGAVPSDCHQIPIAKNDKAYAASKAAGKLWEFSRISFRVTNGVPAFQREINKMIDDAGLKNAFPCLDNVIVLRRSREEHDQNAARLAGSA